MGANGNTGWYRRVRDGISKFADKLIINEKKLHNNENYIELRKFYRTHLRQYWLMRTTKKIVLKLIRGIGRFQINLLLRSPIATHGALITMSAYAERSGSPTTLVAPAAKVEINTPRFVGPHHPNMAYGPTVEVECPKLEVYKYENATAVGHTHFILAGDEVIYPDLYVPAKEVCPAEAAGLLYMRDGWTKMAAYFGSRARQIAKAVSLCGQCTGNYAHWITEVLPKLVIVDACGLYNDWPILIDSGLHKNFLESIALVNVNRRKIIHVDSYKRVTAKELVAVSLPGYTPYEARDLFEHGKLVEFGPHWFHFSQQALGMLRDAVWKAVPENRDVGAGRVYLRRPGNQYGRKPVNQDEIEAVLVQNGFTVIDSGAMSFSDQINLFRNAEFIVSPVGAALTNMVWARPGCRVLCLAAYREDLTYFPYSNLLNIMGHDLQYLLGMQVDVGDHPMHRDYNIDTAILQDIVGRSAERSVA